MRVLALYPAVPRLWMLQRAGALSLVFAAGELVAAVAEWQPQLVLVPARLATRGLAPSLRGWMRRPALLLVCDGHDEAARTPDLGYYDGIVATARLDEHLGDLLRDDAAPRRVTRASGCAGAGAGRGTPCSSPPPPPPSRRARRAGP